MKLRPHRMARTGPLPKYLLRTVKRDIASPSLGILPTGPANAALNARIFFVTANANDVNLFNLTGGLTTPGKFIFVINPGVRIGSSSTVTPGLTMGNGWHAAATIWLLNYGDVRGRPGAGGVGGNGASPFAAGTPGGAGGDAFALTHNLVLLNYGSFAGAGGGGGGGGGQSGFNGTPGGGGGGSGAGTSNNSGGAAGNSSGGIAVAPGNGQPNNGDTPGNGGTAGQDTGGGGTGISGAGGDGGGLAQAGSPGGAGLGLPVNGPQAGGAAGRAIVLNGFTITYYLGQTGSIIGTVS